VDPAAATGGAAAAAAASKLKQLPGSLAEALAALQHDNSLQVRSSSSSSRENCSLLECGVPRPCTQHELRCNKRHHNALQQPARDLIRFVSCVGRVSRQHTRLTSSCCAYYCRSAACTLRCSSCWVQIC
jgi:hypothetical protein